MKCSQVFHSALSLTLGCAVFLAGSSHASNRSRSAQSHRPTLTPRQQKTRGLRTRRTGNTSALKRVSKLPHPASKMERLLLKNQLPWKTYSAPRIPREGKASYSHATWRDFAEHARQRMSMHRDYFDPSYETVTIITNSGGVKTETTLKMSDIRSFNVSFYTAKNQRLDVVAEAPDDIVDGAQSRQYLFQSQRSDVVALVFRNGEGQEKRIALDDLYSFSNHREK